MKNRLDGAAKAMLELRNSERLREFVKCYGLGTEIYKAWKKNKKSFKSWNADSAKRRIQKAVGPLLEGFAFVSFDCPSIDRL